MNPARIWALGAGVAIVAIAAAAVGLGVQPELAAASAADASAAAARTQSSTTQIELARLSRLAATESSLEATDSKLASAITGSLRLSTFSRQVRATAAIDGVKLMTLSPGEATPYAPVGADAAASTASSTSTKTPAAEVVEPGDFGKTSALVTAANFSIIPVTITVTGDEAGSVQFASDLQHMNRLFAVDTVGFASATADDTLPTTTISGTIYALKH